jgi:hypothetical protein
MPRFFFDIHDGENFTPDDVGLELKSLEAAKAEAKHSLFLSRKNRPMILPCVRSGPMSV